MKILFDTLGLTSFIGAITLNVGKWILNANFNAFLTIIISVVALIYGVYKIKDVRLNIKLKKKQLKQ